MPKRLTVVAKDYFSTTLRNELFTRSFLLYPKIFGVSKVDLGIAAKRDEIEYISGMDTWMKCHEEIKAKALADCRLVEEYAEQALRAGEKINSWTEEHIWRADLSVLDNNELWIRYSRFADLQSEVYARGTILVILDFHDFSFVENNLTKILREKLSEDDYQEAFGVFTRPVTNSFAQDQEEDLLRLMTRYYDDEDYRRDVKNKTFEEMSVLYPKFAADLSSHAEKYAWVYYVYSGPSFTGKDFLNFIRDYLDRNIEPNKKLAQIAVDKKQTAATKKKFLSVIRPNNFEKTILELAGKIIWAKPRRKDLQSKSYYHIEKLQHEIARRLFLSLQQVRSASLDIIQRGLAGAEINADELNNLYDFHVVFPVDGRAEVMSGDRAKQFYDEMVEKSSAQREPDVKEIKGTCAFTGRASGRVSVINNAAEMAKMEYGDILVSSATTPAIVMAMKKAAAIITDEGGLTCHASIVSRELGIPCVVGTKIATLALRDGDIVDVDAERGIVKKVS